MIKGKDFNFYTIINGVPCPFFHSTNCTLKTQADLLESTTKDGINGKTFEYANKYTYTLSVLGQSTLLDSTNFITLQGALQTSTKLLWTFTDNLNVIYSGTILIQDTQIDSPHDAISTFQGNFQGDGAYSVVSAPQPTPIGYVVQIKDQFGNIIANVPAPGIYNVLRFDTIDCRSIGVSPDLIIIA